MTDSGESRNRLELIKSHEGRLERMEAETVQNLEKLVEKADEFESKLGLEEPGKVESELSTTMKAYNHYRQELQKVETRTEENDMPAAEHDIEELESKFEELENRNVNFLKFLMNLKDDLNSMIEAVREIESEYEQEEELMDKLRREMEDYES
jgi:chromosome segregation ATPase